MRISDWSSDVCSSDLPGLIGKDVVYACKGKAIEYTEFLLPQALVKADGFVCRCAAIFAEDLRGLECAQIGRGEKDFRAILLDMCCEPATERGCLLSAEVAQGQVCVTNGQGTQVGGG